jgi:hypothetical protein
MNLGRAHMPSVHDPELVSHAQAHGPITICVPRLALTFRPDAYTI